MPNRRTCLPAEVPIELIIAIHRRRRAGEMRSAVPEGPTTLQRPETSVKATNTIHGGS
jgi:hypothetical protein